MTGRHAQSCPPCSVSILVVVDVGCDAGPDRPGRKGT